MLLKAGRTKVTRDNGGFVTHLNMPGWMLRKPRDHGYGPLAMVVESLLDPGRLVAMHEHRNDEIISWVPAGVMRHDDKASGRLVTDSGHLMVMNAGKSFWHSEQTLPTDPPLRMLQIMVRPRELDLEPNIQHGPIEAAPTNSWRHLIGPEGSNAPFFVRNEVDFFDVRLDAGAHVNFPAVGERHLYFYVFSGSVSVGGQQFEEGEQGLSRSAAVLRVDAATDAILVAFLIDPMAPVTRQGTIGDHRKIPPPVVIRVARTLAAWGLGRVIPALNRLP
jgi:redox-sensitive bicupin YhaK (pirin superfamily)